MFWKVFSSEPASCSEISDAVRLFEIIRFCSFDAPLVYLVYRCSGKDDCKGVSCLGWFPYEGQTGNLLRLAARKLFGKKQDCEGVLIFGTLSQVDVTNESSERITLSDARETVRLVLAKH